MPKHLHFTNLGKPRYILVGIESVQSAGLLGETVTKDIYGNLLLLHVVGRSHRSIIHCACAACIVICGQSNTIYISAN